MIKIIFTNDRIKLTIGSGSKNGPSHKITIKSIALENSACNYKYCLLIYCFYKQFFINS